MNWETLPGWFWGIYYLFLFITFYIAMWSITRKKMIRLSLLTIIFVLTIPLVTVVNSIGRPRGANEFEFIIMELQQGAWWAMFAVAGHLFLLVWWLVFFNKRKETPL